MYPDIRPQLLVYSQDSLTCDIPTAVSVLKQVEGVNVQIIDGGSALAISGHKCHVNAWGGYVNFPFPQPIDLAIEKIAPSDVFALNGSFPSPRFFVAFLFPSREQRHYVVSRCDVRDSQPLILRLHTYRDLGNKVFDEVRSIFLEWFQDATTNGFHGETFVCPERSMNRYTAPEKNAYIARQFGWEIAMPQANEVVFPWLELFFRLRRKLPKTKRVSLEFSHPSETQ